MREPTVAGEEWMNECSESNNECCFRNLSTNGKFLAGNADDEKSE